MWLSGCFVKVFAAVRPGCLGRPGSRAGPTAVWRRAGPGVSRYAARRSCARGATPATSASPVSRNPAQVVAHGHVVLGKGVRPAQRPHRDVMRGPLADAGQRGQARDGFLRVVMDAALERSAPDSCACASAMMLLLRALTMPSLAISSTLARARRAGGGRQAVELGERRDDRLAERLRRGGRQSWSRTSPSPAGRGWRAAPISNPLKAPGTRMPGACRIRGASRRSWPSCREMTSGREFRSNSSRVRRSSAGSTGIRLCVNSSSSAFFCRSASP